MEYEEENKNSTVESKDGPSVFHKDKSNVFLRCNIKNFHNSSASRGLLCVMQKIFIDSDNDCSKIC